MKKLFGVRKNILNRRALCQLLLSFLAFCTIHSWAGGKDSPSLIRYNAQTRVFRIDAAGITYVFGVNENGEIQSLYWGQRLGADDPFPSPRSLPGYTSFDPSVNATPQE
ncbi:MAG: hypothetical protein WA400_16215, partial [Silvibacterium sp.]